MTSHQRQRKFIFWAAAMVASLVASGLAMKALSESGVSDGGILWSRGLVCLLCVFGFAKKKRLSLRPKSLKNQSLRALIAGLALTFFTMSYRYLSASAVAVLSNIDIPILLLIGPAVAGKAKRSVRMLSIVAILVLMATITRMEWTTGVFYGIAILTVASALLCFGYVFIRKSMLDENAAITILTPALAIIVYGSVLDMNSVHIAAGLDPKILAWMSLSGVSMFLAYWTTMKLYDQVDIALAEFPTLLAAILIQPLEWLVLGNHFDPIYFAISTAFVLVMALIFQIQYRAARGMGLPIVNQSLPFTCGAACFASMHQYFCNSTDMTERRCAEELKTFELGMTPPENIVALAQGLGFHAELLLHQPIESVKRLFKKGTVLFVTWWDEDAGHYSLVEKISDNEITLMDPLIESNYRTLKLESFIPVWQARLARIIVVRHKL